MLKDANLHNIYWRDVVHTIVYLLNRLQVRVNHTKTPYKLWFGKVLTIDSEVYATLGEMRTIWETLMQD